MAQFVIVPGGWGGGWEWREVGRLLREDGHDVSRVTLTGLGERAHLLSTEVNLDTTSRMSSRISRWTTSKTSSS